MGVWLFGITAPALLDPAFSHGLSDSPTTGSVYVWYLAQALIAIVSVALLLAAILGVAKFSAAAMALLALWLFLALTSLAQGQEIANILLATPLVAVAATTRITFEEALSLGRAYLRILIALSLLMCFIAPESAFLWSSDRTLLGIAQISGIFVHPNTAGPVAAFALALEVGGKGRVASRVVWGSMSALLVVFAQSRSGWSIAAVALLTLWAFRERGSVPPPIRKTIYVVAVMGDSWFALTEVLGSGSDVTSGRTQIWSILIDQYFVKSPIIGGGNEVLAETNRGALGSFSSAVGQAHNQYLQTLIDSGISGAAALVIVKVTAGVCVARTASPHRPVVLATAAGILVLMLTEAPLRPGINGYLGVLMIFISLVGPRTEGPAAFGSRATRRELMLPMQSSRLSGP
jgi:O-antigen ligase